MGGNEGGFILSLTPPLPWKRKKTALVATQVKSRKQLGYRNIILVQGDGGFGHPELAPYDRICLTAACTQIPSPLLEQLKSGGRLIAPVVKHGCQNLTLVEKRADDISTGGSV